jgi:hypothetical protein
VRFDVLPVSLATDGGVPAVGVDRRRFRANVYLSGVEGLTERDWVGAARCTSTRRSSASARFVAAA